MKQIFCLMKYYLDPEESPPFPKFDYQMEALRNLGHTVWYMGIKHGKIFLCSDNTRQQYATIPFHTVPGLGRLLTFNALYRAVIKTFSANNKFDIAYIRMMPAVPPMGRALKKIKATGCKAVMEFPTFPPEREEATEKRLHRKLFIWLSKQYEVHLAHWFDLFSLIGTVKADEYRGRPTINITNGISLASIPLRTFKPYPQGIHLLGVANIQMMNGYDRVILGIEQYRSSKTAEDPEVHFHIVGPDRDGTKEKLIALVHEKQLEEWIHFEGPAFGETLNDYFDRADLAVGSLGLHRIGHTGIATLKAREYLAHGIPFITSGVDPVIPLDRGWCMNFPQDDSAIDIRTILHFISQTKADRSIGLQMREFAKEHLSWETQFKQVFSALETLR